MAKNIIRLIDVTNRDGVQTARLGLAKLQKTMVNRYLDKMGVYQSEFGFPMTGHEKNYLNANISLADKGDIKDLRLSGWLRAIRKDVEDGIKNVPNLKYANISISTSDQMIQGKFKGTKKWEDIIAMMTDALDACKEVGIKGVGVNSEDASRTSDERLIEFSQAAKDHGAERIRYCDTLGYDDPYTIYNRIKNLAEKVQIPMLYFEQRY